MGWTTTSVVTSQVMDENPMTWLNAAANAFHSSNFSQGLEYVNQAIDFGKSNSAILIRGYAYKILLLYGLGRIDDAQVLFSDKRKKLGLDSYLNENPDILVTYLNFDSKY